MPLDPPSVLSSPSPPWVTLAETFIGTKEAPLSANNETILQFFHDAGFPEIMEDRTPWCAAFTAAMLKRTGYNAPKSLLARSYLSSGYKLEAPIEGALAIFPRGNNPAEGHVGFVSDVKGKMLSLLGGNQSDAVSIRERRVSDALGFRWPELGISTFQSTLKSLLKREGGYIHLKDDPGGPTNFGITLTTYKEAVESGIIRPEGNDLLSGLKQISGDDVSSIYLKRYWQQAGCQLLTPPLASFHFDTAVNQGCHRAIRFLQEVCDVEDDGEIGPITLSAIWSRDPHQLIAAYSARRLMHYRQLKTYPIFGKGWQRRLQEAETSALNLKTEIVPSNIPPTKTTDSKETEMNNLPYNTEQKWWAESLTIWGAIVTALSTLLPLFGPLIGIDISSEMVEQFGDTVARLIQILGGLTGTAMTLYGRARADAPLTRRSIDVKL